MPDALLSRPAPSVTVLIATVGRPSLAQTLDTLAQQTLPPERFSVHLVFDGSTAGPLPRAYSFRIIQEAVPAIGKAAALNVALPRSTSPIVAFTDDDCLPDVRWLETILATFAAHPHVGIVSGAILDPAHDPAPVPALGGTRLHAARTISRVTRVWEYARGNNLAARREVFDRVGPYDPDFGPGPWCALPSGQDTEWLVRALLQGEPIRFEPRMRVVHAHAARSRAEIRRRVREDHVGTGGILAKHLLAGNRAILSLVRPDAYLRDTASGRGRRARSLTVLRAASPVARGFFRYLAAARRPLRTAG